jgi:hypothetical protein
MYTLYVDGMLWETVDSFTKALDKAREMTERDFYQARVRRLDSSECYVYYCGNYDGRMWLYTKW